MFQLHERLAADTHNLGRSRLCEILLMNDRTWPWIILVPAVPDIREIYQLGKEQQQRLLEESSTQKALRPCLTPLMTTPPFSVLTKSIKSCCARRICCE